MRSATIAPASALDETGLRDGPQSNKRLQLTGVPEKSARAWAGAGAELRERRLCLAGSPPATEP